MKISQEIFLKESKEERWEEWKAIGESSYLSLDGLNISWKSSEVFWKASDVKMETPEGLLSK